MNPDSPLPCVLCCSGLDPSGGAGLQADIEAVAAAGAHALVALTATTIQNTHNAYAVHPVDDDQFAAAIAALADDLKMHAIKTGVLGSAGQARWLAEFAERQQLPLVTDPVLKAGGGAQLAGDPVARAILEDLLPVTTVLTPNAAEARLLCADAGLIDPADCGRHLSRSGTWVLVTGGDEAADNQSNCVTNKLFHQGEEIKRFNWPRLPHRYHGSGCTLASSIAARLALGETPVQAVDSAQRYTWHALDHAFRPGGGQHIPRRLQT